MLQQDQVAVVTGAAGGIGRGIALALARRGLQVECLDIASLENCCTAREARRLAGVPCTAWDCDVSQAEQVDRVFDQILEQRGRIDVLVNNAGVFSTMSFVSTSYEDALRDFWFNMDTNALGTFLCAKKVAPVMASRGSGQILNVVTNHMKRRLFPPSSSEHSYDASKWAQFGLNESLACELRGYGVRVNAICPAATRTPMLQGFFDQLGLPLNRETLAKCSGFDSLMEIEDVGEAACNILDWDDTQPVGKAFLLMTREDCQRLKAGYAADLAE